MSEPADIAAHAVFQRGRARVQVAVIHLRNLDDNLSIKPRTRHYWRQRPCLAHQELAGIE
jgi:hypothetical protein